MLEKEKEIGVTRARRGHVGRDVRSGQWRHGTLCARAHGAEGWTPAIFQTTLGGLADRKAECQRTR
eukprot:3340260-Heterocapsa_arctica.AAC.1